MHDLVFLFDVDNTLLNNDRVQADLDVYLGVEHGNTARKRYWEIFETLRSELGYADYLGTLERYRMEELHDPKLLRMSNWLVDYPFAERVYRGALEAVAHVRQWGPVVILSDGDAVFVRWARADLHPQGRRTGRCGAVVSGEALRDDRRQAAHPGYHEDDLRSAADDGVSAAGALRVRSGNPGEIPAWRDTVEPHRGPG